MRVRSVVVSCVMAGSLMLVAGPASAKVSAAKAAELGGKTLTCQGAERAGSADGVAAYTGKYLGAWPGMKGGPGGYKPGPYADEKPLFTITANNMSKYKDKLTPGEIALLKKYPKSYRMNVYPSHRDFRFPSWVCDTVKKNAVTAKVIHGGLGITGTTGAIPFPFPQNGLQAIWNVINPTRAWTEKSIENIADVYGSNIAWGKTKFMTMNMGNNPKKRGSYQARINSYFFTSYIEPDRLKGFTAVGYQPNDFSNDATRSWQYLPGLRRVREAPKVGFDYPVPPAGLRTVDDDYGFNGSPERYTWKLIGKKEMYVPYDNFKINDPSIKYSDLLTPNTINPKYERYELHRVWVIEGDLKPGVRDVYHKRIVYADEDTWLVLWADDYDSSDHLWRANIINFFYSPQSDTWERSACVYHDLTANAYEANYLVNSDDPDDWWQLNTPMTPEMFSPQAAARAGH